MRAVLIFDNVNDLLFSKWDDTFLERMKAFGGQIGDANVTDGYNVSQLLSPIITSQRVMAAQFGNTYSSMRCKDGTSIVFDEWLDHVFLIISEDEVDDAHRELLDCKTLVQHICGQNINLLHSAVYQRWLSVLLESRTKGDTIPGASGVIGGSGATGAAINALKNASKEIKCSPYQRYHLLLYVGDKLLALYSSRGCDDLTPADLILLTIQSIAAQEYWTQIEKSDDIKEQSPKNDSHIPWLSAENSGIVYVCAASTGAPCSPHSMHIAAVSQHITLIVLVDMDIRDIGVTAHLSSQILANLRRLLLQRNLDMLPASLDALESALKKTTEALRKNKANVNLCARLTTRMLELRKSCTTTTPLTPETTAAAMHTALEAVIEQLRPDIPSLNLEHPMKELQTILAPYLDFLRVKAMRCFSLGSYVDEFPGLVHFVYTDRTAGRSLAPDMSDCRDLITPHHLRAMITRSFKLTREGYCAATWRGGATHACAVLWWERSGAPVKPRALHPAAVRALPPPGDILGSFYRQLTEQAFPNDTANITVKELLCVHLGLLPAAAAVQQARRLAHTVHEADSQHDHRPRASDLLYGTLKMKDSERLAIGNRCLKYVVKLGSKRANGDGDREMCRLETLI